MPSKTFPEPLGNHCDQLLPLTMPLTLSPSSAQCLHKAPRTRAYHSSIVSREAFKMNSSKMLEKTSAYHSSMLPQVLVNILTIMSIAKGAMRIIVALVTLNTTIIPTISSAGGHLHRPADELQSSPQLALNAPLCMTGSPTHAAPE